ncbi:MAG: hypothetical protein JNJ69_12975 [Leptospiraceae bacterium]|nr:hypothetical protein [Leptospiraceae bacterium]
MALNDAQKAELMRKGNLLFNQGRYFEAGKVFNVIGYKTGLIRLGDLFYFEKEMPLVAYGFYRNANHKPMLEKIGDSFVFALKCLLHDTGEGVAKKAASRPAAANEEESLKIREANAPGEMRTAPPESIDAKVARAVAMLQKLN